MSPKPLADLGAGLTTKAPSIEPHPAGPPQYGTPGQVERAFTAASTFFSGMLAISASQLLGAPLKAIDTKFYDAYVAFTKQSFGVLVTTMTQWFSPTVIRVSGDKSIPGQLLRKEDGSLQCHFPRRLILMANHQLYSDWLYLWYISYTNNMHGYIYIILKESLKHVPLIGWGAQFYNFIFLSRNWEKDKQQFSDHLDQLNIPSDPMWLLIFPEGTNLARGTREKSRQWAEKNGLQDMKHVLLPRSRGLQLSLQRLGGANLEYLYDCTIAYEGIPPGQYGQDIFTLRSSMFEGRPPKSVNIHFRRFKISNIPVNDDQAFEIWLRNRWREKDYLLEHYARFDSFPEDIGWMSRLRRQPNTKQYRPSIAKCIETQVKSNNAEEYLSIFAPITSVGMLTAFANGGLNLADLRQMLGKTGELGADELKAVSRHLMTQQKAMRGETSPQAGVTSMKEIDKLVPAAAQRELMQRYLGSMQPGIVKEVSLPITASDSNSGARKASRASAPLTTRASNPRSKQAVAIKTTKIVPTNATKAKVGVANAPSQASSIASTPRTIRPDSSVSKARPNAQRTKNQAIKIAPAALQRFKAAQSAAPTRPLVAIKQGNRKVNIDSNMLAKMKAAKS